MRAIPDDDDVVEFVASGFALHDSTVAMLLHGAAVEVFLEGPVQQGADYGIIGLSTQWDAQDGGAAPTPQLIAHAETVRVLDPDSMPDLRNVAAVRDVTMDEAKREMLNLAKANTPLCKVRLSPVLTNSGYHYALDDQKPGTLHS